MPRRHRSHSTKFKRPVVADYHAGGTLHALGRRHDLSRNLIRIWIEKAEAGALDEDAAAAELLADHEARVAVSDYAEWRRRKLPRRPFAIMPLKKRRGSIHDVHLLLAILLVLRRRAFVFIEPLPTV